MSKLRRTAAAKSATAIVVTNASEVAEYFDQLTERLQRKVIRQAVGAGGQILVKKTREVLKREQKTTRGTADPGDKPLWKTITKKPWSKPQRGLIGTVVGPAWPAGAHGYNVEHGHDIVISRGPRAGESTGRRTRALEFQSLAEQISVPEVRTKQIEKLRAAIAKERGKIRKAARKSFLSGVRI